MRRKANSCAPATSRSAASVSPWTVAQRWATRRSSNASSSRSIQRPSSGPPSSASGRRQLAPRSARHAVAPGPRRLTCSRRDVDGRTPAASRGASTGWAMWPCRQRPSTCRRAPARRFSTSAALTETSVQTSLDVVERERAREHRETAEDRLLGRVEQVVRPLDGGEQCLVARFGATPGREQREALVETGRDIGQRHAFGPWPPPARWRAARRRGAGRSRRPMARPPA